MSTHRSERWRIAKRIAHHATLFLALMMGWPGVAQAWTRSVVDSAAAELEVLASGELRVVLRIGLQVQGGWLSRFDVAGLEPDLQLDPSAAAWLVSRTDGRAYAPEVSSPAPGQVTVGFAHRRDAPWRGDYELGIVYTARSPLTHADQAAAQRLGLAWQMPIWDRGLEDVRVRVSGAGALEPRPEPELAHVVRVSKANDGTLEFRRVQLPRATPWTVRFTVPRHGVAGAGSPSPKRAAAPLLTDRPFEPLPLVLALLLGALALAKHASVRRAALQRNAEALPLVPMSARMRHPAIVVLCVAGAALAARSVDAALWAWGSAVLLALHRGVRPLPARPWTDTRPRLQAPRPGAARLQRCAELFVGRAWLDLSTPVGAALALAVLGFGLALCALPHGSSLPLLGALLLLPLFLTGTRLHLPRGAAARLGVLARLREALRLPAPLRAEVVTDGRRIDPRLRIGPVAHRGVEELAIVLHDVAWLGRVRSVTALRVRARAGARAAERLQQALPSALRSETAHGIEWLQPTGTPEADLASLLGWLDALDADERAAA